MASVKVTAIFTTALFLMAAGSVSAGWQMYFMAAVLLALPAASYAVGWASLRGLSVQRELPTPSWSGETADFALTVGAADKLPRMFLEVRDSLPKWLRRTDAAPVTFDVPAGSAARVRYGVDMAKRGVYRLASVSVVARDPLGLFAFRRSFPAEGELVVYPTPEDIGGIVLTGSERYGYRDFPFPAAHGSGGEPDGVREYVPGDQLRRMHWKSVARTGKLNVIEFEESRSLSVVLALDTYRGGDIGEAPESTFEYLIRAAASIAQSAVREGAGVRLVGGGASGLDSRTGRGVEHLMAVLALLAEAEATDTTRISTGLRRHVGTLTAGSTLVVLTADPDPFLAESLSAYTVAGLRSVVVVADGPSFLGKGRRVPHDSAMNAFITSLAGARAETFVLRRSETRRLTLESARTIDAG